MWSQNYEKNFQFSFIIFFTVSYILFWKFMETNCSGYCKRCWWTGKSGLHRIFIRQVSFTKVLIKLFKSQKWVIKISIPIKSDKFIEVVIGSKLKW